MGIDCTGHWGVVRMAHMSSPWRALRPVLLAGAAAVTWLTLSSTAASADTGPDSPSLLGGVTSSISSLTSDLADVVSPAPAGSPARPASGPAATSGMLQPVVTQVSGLADNLISSVPVVDQVVPAGTVSSVSAPVVEVADSVAAGAVQVVLDPAAGAVPALEPVLQPVSDLLTGSAQLPLPGLPVEVQQPVQTVTPDVPAAEAPASAEPRPALAEAAEAVVATASEPAPADALAAGPLAAGNAVEESQRADGLTGTSVLQWDVSSLSDPAADQPLPVDPVPPAQAPAVPGSGAGSGTSSGGPTGAAAWLSPYNFDFERPVAVLAGDSLQHAPAPVSFDPGSSPD